MYFSTFYFTHFSTIIIFFILGTYTLTIIIKDFDRESET